MDSGKLRERMLGVLVVLCVGVFVATAAHAVQKPDSKDTGKDAEQSVDADPLEPLNRGIYWFNHVLDVAVIKPVTQAYRFVVPEQGRTMVDNFITNLYTPVVLVNSVLQRDPQNSFATGWRFILNTTFGLGGLFDFASAVGLHNRPADLGETMAFYGAGNGPYVVLPIIGPSNVRDAFGRLGDAFMMPTNYAPGWFSGSTGNWIEYGTWGATVINERSKDMQLIDDIYANSLDPYSTFRSGYTQKRASDIRRAKAARDKALANASCHP